MAGMVAAAAAAFGAARGGVAGGSRAWAGGRARQSWAMTSGSTSFIMLAPSGLARHVLTPVSASRALWPCSSRKNLSRLPRTA